MIGEVSSKLVAPGSGERDYCLDFSLCALGSG
ncbi:hypothetical protein EV184_110252 [Sinorhizobium americanum]|uniref:Uncharacterized protein n=1 Tax=Sinorhizobium americanum TaxID=194963 RepID=A0A4R2BPQ7_9HYPH|nr:hypothetical protein EV184_110252 [Sinorhizobium americanum]